MASETQETTAPARVWQAFTALLPYAVLILLFAVMGGRDLWRGAHGERAIFFTLDNFKTLARECAPVIVAAAGMTLAIVCGGIDLSAGSTMGLAAAVAGYCANATGNAFLGLALGMLAGLACGAFNGLMVIGLRVPPFIATLGTLMALRGACEIVTHSGSIFVGDGLGIAERGALNANFQWLAKSELPLGIPMPIALAALVVAAFWVLLNHTRLGRRAYAVGSNEDAARLSGVRVGATKWMVYAICGLMSGIAGVLVVSRMGGPSANTAIGQELVIISAVVIGGASLAGGQGTISGCVIGALLMSALSGACTSFGVPDSWQKVIIGLFLVGAVAIDQLRRAKLEQG